MLKTRALVAAIAVPVLFVIMFFLPPVFLAVITAVICAGVVIEFLNAFGMKDKKLLIATIASGVLLPFCMLSEKAHSLAAGVIVLFIGFLFGYSILGYEKRGKFPAEVVLICGYIGIIYPLMMGGLILLKASENGRLLVLLPVICTWMCDTAAYFAGMKFGNHKVTPRVSPHKSLEGFIGGIVGGIISMIIYGIIVALSTELRVNFIVMAIYGAIGSVAVELGDLAYSLFKRISGIKDYGNLIPGHGGMLDRFDSMSFAAPLFAFLVAVLPVFKL